MPQERRNSTTRNQSHAINSNSNLSQFLDDNATNFLLFDNKYTWQLCVKCVNTRWSCFCCRCHCSKIDVDVGKIHNSAYRSEIIVQLNCLCACVHSSIDNKFSKHRLWISWNVRAFHFIAYSEGWTGCDNSHIFTAIIINSSGYSSSSSNSRATRNELSILSSKLCSFGWQWINPKITQLRFQMENSVHIHWELYNLFSIYAAGHQVETFHPPPILTSLFLSFSFAISASLFSISIRPARVLYDIFTSRSIEIT